MADPQFVSAPASPESAEYIVALIGEVGALAEAHFEQLPEGEEATVYVTLNTPTGYGVITLGMWAFARDAEGAVTLVGSTPEASNG